MPAAATGALQILATAGQNALDRVRPVLETLGTVRHVDDASSAAALNLIANNSLAGAVLALCDSLRQADALSRLGALAARKRPFLLDEPTAASAEFTIGALAKDMALPAAASDTPLRSATGLSDTPAAPEADVAVAATVPAVKDAVLEPLRAYIRGHATGKPLHFRDGAFRLLAPGRVLHPLPGPAGPGRTDPNPPHRRHRRHRRPRHRRDHHHDAPARRRHVHRHLPAGPR